MLASRVYSNKSALNVWCVDSGSTHNICHDRQHFERTSLQEMSMDIRLGDDNVVTIKQKGIVKINGVLVEALYAPQFRICLLSAAYFDKLGYRTDFYKGVGTIYKPDGEPLLEAHLTKGLYLYTPDARAFLTTTRSMARPSANNAKNEAAFEVVIPVTSKRPPRASRTDHEPPQPLLPDNDEPIEDNDGVVHDNEQDFGRTTTDLSGIVDRLKRRRAGPHLWHARFDHVSADALRRAVDPNLVEGKIAEAFDCETCIMSKHKQSFERTPVARSKIPFERIHSDLCGPFRHTSNGGHHYYILFIDDATRYPTLYHLVTKRSEEISKSS